MNTEPKSPTDEYRNKNFAVEIHPARHPLAPGELSMQITHNGYQWTNICLFPDEANKVAEALLAALANAQAEPRRENQ